VARATRRIGHLACVKLLISEGADIQQAGAVRAQAGILPRGGGLLALRSHPRRFHF
jgi:hypothetical protein